MTARDLFDVELVLHGVFHGLEMVVACEFGGKIVHRVLPRPEPFELRPFL
jgi:hypothetical protein